MVEGEDYESAMGFVKSRRRQEVVELKRGVGWSPKWPRDQCVHSPMISTCQSLITA